MILWLILTAMTAAALWGVLRPLLGSGASRPISDTVPPNPDVEIYRDQLDEIDADRAQGRMGDAEAAATQAEIGRRLIQAENARTAQSSAVAKAPGGLVLAVLALFPILVFAVYASRGAPNLPGQPLASRTEAPASDASLGELVARIESHLLANPDDGKGWEVVAPIYLRHGRPADAIMAYRNVIRLLGATAPRYADLGEAIALSQGGLVTAESQQAFHAALELEPQSPKARFYLALAAEQDGKLAQAAEMWRSMLVDAPANAPWREPVETSIARVEGNSAKRRDLPVAGPTADDIAAASQMSSDERQQMIEGMVSNLEAKLQEKPDDTGGWLMLVRAYMVMGRRNDAVSAAETAMNSISDREGRRRLAELAVELDIPLPEEINQ